MTDAAYAHVVLGTGAGDAALDSTLRVHGPTGLHVMDASAFPFSPGFFIAAAVRRVGKEAAEATLAEAVP